MRFQASARAAGALCVAAALAGCNAGGPRVSFANGRSEAFVDRQATVASGSTVRIGAAADGVNPDCSTWRQADVRPARQPAHGRLTIRSTSVYTGFSWRNPRSRCNAEGARGAIVEYQSAAGYRGDDSLAYDVFTSTGGHIRVTVTIHVI